MNDLFNLKLVDICGDQIRVVDARELHKFLEVGRDFSTWIKDRIDQEVFIESQDYVVFPRIGENLLGGRPIKEYGLTIRMAKELSMLERNEQGKVARQYFIDCEERLAVVAPKQHQIAVNNWQKARINSRDYQKMMCAALASSRARQDKETSEVHYSNEANLLYGLLVGTTAKKWLATKGLNGELRQHLSSEQLAILAYLERTNTTLLEMGMSYEERKEQLSILLNLYKKMEHTYDV